MAEGVEDGVYTRNLGRNVGIGLIAAYAVTVGLCFAATGELGLSAAVAGVPALFAGPYLGLLVTLIAAVRPRPAEAVTGTEPGASLADVA